MFGFLFRFDCSWCKRGNHLDSKSLSLLNFPHTISQPLVIICSSSHLSSVAKSLHSQLYVCCVESYQLRDTFWWEDSKHSQMFNFKGCKILSSRVYTYPFHACSWSRGSSSLVLSVFPGSLSVVWSCISASCHKYKLYLYIHELFMITTVSPFPSTVSPEHLLNECSFIVHVLEKQL